MSVGSIMYSGGAQGADKLWGEIAEKLGHKVVHYTFSGHGVSVPKRLTETLSQESLNLADPYLIQANKTLKRRFPTGKPYIDNLLRRNYWQIKDTERVYAIASFENPETLYGGTAWAVQMARLRSVPCYVFDPSDKTWTADLAFGGWRRNPDVAMPRGAWTGIGTRRLTEETKEYIISWMLG